MKQPKVFQRVMAAILFASIFAGCSTFLPGDTASLTPVGPSETLKTTYPPTSSSTPIPSVSPSPRPTATATPIPGWITDFAEPILAAIADRPADVQEDFLKAGPIWYLETVNCPNNGCGITDGVLSVAAFPVDHKDAWAEQPFPCCTGFKTFVMRVDVNTANLNGENTASIWYTDTTWEGNRFTTIFQYDFELTRSGKWYSLIGPSGMYGGENGQLPSSVPALITFTLISRGSRFAVYLNELPITYGEYAGGESAGGQHKIGFELCAWSDGSGAARAEYDNLKVWNLDNIPGLP
jgi:hypothetical protein